MSRVTHNDVEPFMDQDEPCNSDCTCFKCHPIEPSWEYLEAEAEFLERQDREAELEQAQEEARFLEATAKRPIVRLCLCTLFAGAARATFTAVNAHLKRRTLRS